MTSLKSLVTSFAFAGLAVAHGASPVKAADATSLRVKPLGAVNMTLGTKRAIGYFTADGSTCNATLVLSEVNFKEEPGVANNATRISTAIGAGTSSRVDTEWGPSLVLSCETGAAGMTVQAIDRVAYAKPRN